MCVQSTRITKANWVTDPSSRLQAVIDRIQPAMRARFLQIVRDIKDELTLDLIEEFLATGQIDAALATAEVASLKLGRAWGEAFVFAGDEAAKFLAGALHIAVNFDEINDWALSRMKENQLRLVREFGAEQRRATKEAIEDGIRRGVNPRQVAREFRDSIGLTQRQVQAVNNYRRMLENNDLNALTRQLRDKRFDSSFRRAVREGRPLGQEQIDKMVGRYRERYLKYRSEVIARTEALRSANEGTDSLYRQAIDDGTLNANDLEREWMTAADERVRGYHRYMHHQRRPIGESFMSGSGARLCYPGDADAPASETVQCRCVVATRFKVKST